MEATANLDLFNKFETIDFETGELVNVLDESFPVQSRLDSARWLIDRFNAEIDICKNRKQLWNERENIIKVGIDKIRESIKSGMTNEGTNKIKTIENTAFLTSKEILVYNEALIRPEPKLYDVTVKDLSYETHLRLCEYAKTKGLQTSAKEKIVPEKLPPELVRHVNQIILTIRKSPKTE